MYCTLPHAPHASALAPSLASLTISLHSSPTYTRLDQGPRSLPRRDRSLIADHMIVTEPRVALAQTRLGGFEAGLVRLVLVPSTARSEFSATLDLLC